MPDGSIKHLRDLARCLRDEAGNEEVVGRDHGYHGA